ncbi:hypothetical protein [uncultured Pelagimonas sp.]|uniref:hypothetical protein n=1 Tax=uncultured Pelagimonas sp. TaxID=1618102 RepID=UPI0026236A96|nr:hypothetical protein [uncultured Pelagimonas sp.]
MTSQEASKLIASAIETLKMVRDELGTQLCSGGAQLDLKNPETRRMSDLHDRAARTLAAYRKET